MFGSRKVQPTTDNLNEESSKRNKSKDQNKAVLSINEYSTTTTDN